MKDIGNPIIGRQKISIARSEMEGLRNIVMKYKDKSPLKGTSIVGCTTLTPQTGVFILALKELGAKVSWCSDNQFASDDDVVTYLKSINILVFARSNMNDAEYFKCMELAIEEIKNDNRILIADDGCDITRYLATQHNELLNRAIGLTEQTTCGINSLRALYLKKLIKIPSLNINSCFTKQWFDNFYGIQQSIVQALANLGISVPSKKITVFGYGPVGKGAAHALRNMGAQVSIVEKNQLLLLQAEWDGFGTFSVDEALRNSDMCFTATGCIDTISGRMIKKYAKPGLYLGNIGHGTSEYDVNYLEEHAKKFKVGEMIDEYALSDGKKIYSLCCGALVNLIAGKGNSSKVMSLTFTLILLAHIDLSKSEEKYTESKIYDLTEEIELESVRLNSPSLVKKVYLLNNKQRKYLYEKV